jgi:serine/threonine protein kinase
VAAPKKPANNAPVFGRWQGVRPIGRGGFGQTIEVKHLDNNKFAIVKIINSDHYGDDYHDYVRRFKREMKILSELDHPNICRLYEANFDTATPWFAMERYKGNTVAEELEQYGPAPEKIWFDRARDILSALAYAHSKKIIHGDLNPGNVIIDGRGAKLIDFGIARRDGNYDSNSTKIFGANGWTSPEYGTLPPAIADDIFVAASLLVKLGTGNHAFKANTVNNYLPSIINDEPDYSGLSTNQIQLLRKMHAKTRDQRCSAATALSLIDRLEPSASARPIINKASKPQIAKKPIPQIKKVAPIKKAPQDRADQIEIRNRFNERALPADPRILRSLPEIIKLYKGLVISSFFLGSLPLIFYWILSITKRTKKLSYSKKFPLAISAMIYFLTFGILSPFATLWWGRHLGFKTLKPQLFIQIFFLIYFVTAVGNQSGEAASDLAAAIFLIGVANSFYGFKKIKDLVIASVGSTVESEPEVAKAPAPASTKVEIREGEEGSQVVATQRTWEEVERFFVQALSSKRGKRFIFEIESSVYSDIYFQGYSEPDLSRTIEAAADLSVRPKLSDKQKLSMSAIGWDLPSEDLPNFIMFLESAESGDRSLAQIFTKTLREGYGLELGTFSVIAPVR